MPGPLRSLLAEPRPPGASGPSRLDWLLVAVCAATAAVEGALRPDQPGGAVAVVLAVGLAPVLLIRRSRPLLAVTLAFGATLLAPLLTGGVKRSPSRSAPRCSPHSSPAGSSRRSIPWSTCCC
ncbi:hypothetical protein [Actinoplanes sp. L3-i22]|uniref:hypothetical protein n=1 Tax=Actinoplanes sp. L3-i22 TaxID=2836373 RepID=UPI001C741B7D|nr:hypothetical protein [Actinoplanes sp. L3-i22]BCY12576.1 hypothetical protein L3i22_076640 [Actinoplanes sp. L3-i22]